MPLEDFDAHIDLPRWRTCLRSPSLNETAPAHASPRRAHLVELGFAAPIDAGMRRHALDERRRVSSRWLNATCLAGIFGGGLMGAAVLASLDSQTDFAEKPEFVAQQALARPSGASAVTVARKGDKLVRKVDLLNAKQTFRTPTTIRVGDKEVIKVRAFARVTAPLLLADTDVKDEVPPFNAVKLMSDGAEDRTADAPQNAPDDGNADVSLITRDLAGFSAAKLSQATLGDDEARRQAADAFQAARRATPPVGLTPQSMLARAMQVAPVPGLSPLGYASIGSAPFTGLDVRLVPENVTVVPKLEIPAARTLPDERVVTLKKGETADAALRAAGVEAGQARDAGAVLAKDAEIAEGKRLRLLFAPANAGDLTGLVRAMLYKDDAVEAITARDDRGLFVSVAPQVAGGKSVTATRGNDGDGEDDDAGDGINLYTSLYETGLKNDMPRPVIDNLMRIFSYDVDFQRRVSGGDSVDVLYAEEDDGDTKKSDVLYASVQINGETRRYFRYLTPDDNGIDYYDENGRSAKKFLLRKPIADGTMRSGFGLRRHPILGYTKMHTGVDWANKVGTPILAAGDGVVVKAEWDSGYGRRTEIQHVNGYVTSYNHQSAFARGIKPGARVRQGQVIGYLGSSGLATGPHLHYEVIVNDHFVDPMRIKLPRGRELNGRMLADFNRERERIETVLSKAPNQLRVVAQQQ